MENLEFKKRALRAYERGRWMSALRYSWLSVGVGAAALLLFGPRLEIGIFSATAIALSIGLGWLHDDFKEGARLGAGLGVVQIAAAAYMFYVGMPFFPAWCEQACFGIVTVGSGLVGYLYARQFSQRSTLAAGRGALGMISVGVCMAVVGCLPGNSGLLIGGLIGAPLAIPPTMIVLRRRYV